MDTNVLVRLATADDPRQVRAAVKLIEGSELIAVTLPSLCEMVWVLRNAYLHDRAQILTAIDALLALEKVVVDRPAADAGLAMLRDGGDFADGVIAYEGGWLGGEIFASFDKKAVALLEKQGRKAHLLS